MTDTLLAYHALAERLTARGLDVGAIENKVEAMVLSVVNLQESYARSLLVDRAAPAGARA